MLADSYGSRKITIVALGMASISSTHISFGCLYYKVRMKISYKLCLYMIGIGQCLPYNDACKVKQLYAFGMV